MWISGQGSRHIKRKFGPNVILKRILRMRVDYSTERKFFYTSHQYESPGNKRIWETSTPICVQHCIPAGSYQSALRELVISSTDGLCTQLLSRPLSTSVNSSSNGLPAAPIPLCMHCSLSTGLYEMYASHKTMLRSDTESTCRPRPISVSLS